MFFFKKKISQCLCLEKCKFFINVIWNDSFYAIWFKIIIFICEIAMPYMPLIYKVLKLFAVLVMTK